MHARLLRIGKLVALPVALALLAAVVASVGPRAVAARLFELRWVLPLVLAIGLLKHLLRAAAWMLAMRADGVAVYFRDLLRARIGAQAFAYLSGMGLLVSESLRPWLLGRSYPVGSVVAASAVESGLYLFTSVFVTCLGLGAAAWLLGIGGTSWLLVWGGVFVLIAYLLFGTRPLLPLLQRLAGVSSERLPKLARVLAQASAKEREIRSFRLRHPRHTGAVLALDLLVQVVMLAEVWLILWAIGLPVGLRTLLSIEGGNRAVKMLGFYVPGRIGADEAGAAGIFALIGLEPAAGVTLALVRRAQALVWAGVGFLWLAGAARLRRRGVPSTCSPATDRQFSMPVPEAGFSTARIAKEAS